MEIWGCSLGWTFKVTVRGNDRNHVLRHCNTIFSDNKDKKQKQKHDRSKFLFDWVYSTEYIAWDHTYMAFP